MTCALIEGTIYTERLSLFHLRNEHTRDRARLLLLGGSNFDLRLKRSFLETALVRDFDFVTYEPRGIGRSEQPPGPWDMIDFAADALSLLDALDWQNTYVVGESFGGMTALHLALLAPDRIKRIAVAGATAGGPLFRSYDISEFLTLPREEGAIAALFLQDERKRRQAQEQPGDFAKALASRLTFEEQFESPSKTSGGYARLLEARRSHNCVAQVVNILTPTIVLAGLHDRQAPTESQKALSEMLPNARYHAFEAGHGVLFEHPLALKAATEFFAEDSRHQDSVLGAPAM